jgi:hypothetical protein
MRVLVEDVDATLIAGHHSATITLLLPGCGVVGPTLCYIDERSLNMAGGWRLMKDAANARFHTIATSGCQEPLSDDVISPHL